MDTSALVKLVVAEEESWPLQKFLSEQAEDALLSAALSRTELIPRVAPSGAQAVRVADFVNCRIHFTCQVKPVLYTLPTLFVFTPAAAKVAVTVIA
jgi:hypothetical protein